MRRNQFLPRLLKGAVFLAGIFLIVPFFSFATNAYRASQLVQADLPGPEDIKKAIELMPSRSKYWYLLGREYRRKAHHFKQDNMKALILKRDAVTALHTAAALSPTNAFLWHNLGSLEYASGYEKEAVASLEQSVYWSPVSLKYSIYLLSVYIREMEQASSEEEKLQFWNKAKVLYQKLEGLEARPRPGDYETWMGEYAYKRLQQLRETMI